MVTTRSTGMNPVAMMHAANIDVMVQPIPRAARGMGVARIADAGD